MIERRINTIRKGIESETINLLVADLQGPRLFMSTSDLPQSSMAAASDISETHGDILPGVDRESLLLEHVEECRIWIRKLMQYASLNLEGFRKVLKKYDKKHEFKTNLLDTHYSSRVLAMRLATFNQALAQSSKYLDECTEILLNRITGSADSTKKGNATLNEVRKVWNDIYALQVRSILENDDVERLLEITQSLDLDRVTGDTSEGSPGRRKKFLHSPSKLPERTLSLLEREHALLLKYLLDGICHHQSLRCLQLLIDSGLDVSRVERWMNISLIFKTVSGIPVRAPLCGTIGESPASERASIMIKMLLENMATTTWVDVRGRNIVHQAVFAGSYACMLKLLGTKSKTKVNFQHFDNDGCAPLFFAIQSGNVDITMLLMSLYDQENAKYVPVATMMISHMPQDQHAIEPLILACKLGHLDLVKAMIDRHLDLNVIDADGETALYHCAKRDYPHCLELLLKSGADPELPEKYDLWTPLFAAAALGCSRCVDILVSNGAKKDAVDRDGWTPFEHAMFRGHISLAMAIKPFVLHDYSLTNIVEIAKPKQALESQEYGHEYLDAKKVLRLTIGHRSGPRNQKPLVELLDRPVTGPLGLQLRVASSNAALGGPAFLDLPVRDEPNTITFLLSNGLAIYYSPWDELRFDLLRASPDGSAEVAGRGSITLSMFLKDDGSPAAFGSKQFVVPILDRIRLEPMALVSFEVLIACPFKPEKVKEKQTKIYWKSVTTKVIGHRGLGANAGLAHPQIGENTLLSFVMAASLGAEYVEFGKR